MAQAVQAAMASLKERKKKKLKSRLRAKIERLSIALRTIVLVARPTTPEEKNRGFLEGLISTTMDATLSSPLTFQ